MKNKQTPPAVTKVQSIIQALGLEMAITERQYSSGRVTTFPKVVVTSDAQYVAFIMAMSKEWGKPLPVSGANAMYIWETDSTVISCGACIKNGQHSMTVIVNSAINARSTAKAAAHLRSLLPEASSHFGTIDIGEAVLQTLDTCAFYSLPYNQDVYDDLCNEASLVLGPPAATGDNGDSNFWNLDEYTRLIVTITQHGGISVIIQVFMGGFK